MKIADADILVVPGYLGSGPDHWQSRWVRHLSTARWVEGPDWRKPNQKAWVSGIMGAVEAATRPVLIVGHSMGVAAIVHAAAHFPEGVVRGGFLVAYADVQCNDWIPGSEKEFAPMPRDPLPFPSLLVASRNDPYCSFDVADDLGAAWGSLVIDAGMAGHVNAESGHGPWPEGGLTFGKFLKRLKV